MGNRWHRAGYEHFDHGLGRQTNHITAILAASGGSGIHQLYELAWPDGTRRWVFNTGHVWPGTVEGTRPPASSNCLDLYSLEQFCIVATDADVRARKVRITELPVELRAAWPRDGHGEYRPTGIDGSGAKEPVGLDDVRDAMRLVESKEPTKSQEGLF